MRIVRADVLGFCFGVNRAVEMIETETREHGPLYTLGAIVHNAHVVETPARRHDLHDRPPGAADGGQAGR